MDNPYPVDLPPLPDGFRFITGLRDGDVYIELVDYRDLSLKAFRKENVIDEASRSDIRNLRLNTYGIHIGRVNAVNSQRKMLRAARGLARKAWLASSCAPREGGEDG